MTLYSNTTTDKNDHLNYIKFMTRLKEQIKISAPAYVIF